MARGLDGVVAAETILSHTDRTNGMVWVRGHDLPTLVADHGFEGTVALLWNDFAGEGLSRTGVADAFGQARNAAFAGLPAWLPETLGRPLFEGMRIAIAAQPDSADAVDLVAALTVAVPALVRQTAGLSPSSPDASLSTAGDLLRMLRGTSADAAKIHALDT
jgi:citrate synthase